MRRLHALFLAFAIFHAAAAHAQPVLSVTTSEVPSGGTITVTITAAPGLYWALIGSLRDNGFAYGGTVLAVGTDVQVLSTGFVGPTGSVEIPFVPPLTAGIDTYFLQAVTSASAGFVPLSASNPVALRPRGLYANAPTFADGLRVAGARITQLGSPTAATDAATKGYVDLAVTGGLGSHPVFASGLSAGGSRVTSVATPVSGADAANKDYVDTSAVRLAPPATQSLATSSSLIDVEQRGSGPYLLSLRTNSSTFPGGGVQLNSRVFRVQPDGSFAATGVLGIGVIPVTGSGERLMWHSYKGAFRAGSIGSGGTYWDDANVGFYTWAGGYNTTAIGLSSFAMGYLSQAQGSYSTATGYRSAALGVGAVAMGYRVGACSDYSLALGQRATTAAAPTTSDECAGTTYAGAMVIADASTTNWVSASATNQFTVRAAGGYRLFTNAALTTGVQLAAGGSGWAVVSDRNAKYDFEAVDEQDVLRRVMTVPVSTYRYKDGNGRRYIGPVAQDFHDAFPFDDDDRHIMMNDLDGVALAAIKALGARVEELREANERMAREAADLRAQLADVLRRLGGSAPR